MQCSRLSSPVFCWLDGLIGLIDRDFSGAGLFDDFRFCLFQNLVDAFNSIHTNISFFGQFFVSSACFSRRVLRVPIGDFLTFSQVRT